MKTIDLVYFNAGGGHRAAALALQSVCQSQGRPWQVRLVNLFEVLDPTGRFTKVTGFRPEDIYNQRLARGWTLGLAQELKMLQGLIRAGHVPLVRALTQHWLASEPDLVVSLVPNFNRALYTSVRQALPGVPFVTALTDLADYPPHFWIEPGQDQYLICGTAKAVAQAREAGYAPSKILATSGMILRPDFYTAPAIDRFAERRRHGLDPDRLTGLVLFGGHGSKAMLSIARELTDTPLILICGHNRALADRLRRLPANAPRLVVSFTQEIAYYMKLADFFIGKPGPGSLSEAVQQGLPVLVVDNAWTMPQERYNPQWIREQGLGIVLRSYRGMARGVAEIGQRLPELQQGLRRIENRAVFEIPEFFARLLQMSEVPAPEWRLLWGRPAVRPTSGEQG